MAFLRDFYILLRRYRLAELQRPGYSRRRGIELLSAEEDLQVIW